MSLTRAAHRVLMASFAGPGSGTERRLPEWVRRAVDDGLGALALFADNVVGEEGAAPLTLDAHRGRAGIIVAMDEEGGDVTRLHHRSGSTRVGAGVLGRIDDVEATRSTAERIGADLYEQGVDLALAPVADVGSDPRNPVIGARSFGGDPVLVARHVTAWVEGVQRAGVGACLKHFPGHGDTTIDSHVGVARVRADAGLLDRRDFTPFRAGIRAGVHAVMGSHVVVEAIDPRRVATCSPEATRLLRAAPSAGGLGFDGALLTDALDMEGARGAGDIPARAVSALAAGADLMCLGARIDDSTFVRTVEGLERAVRTGAVPAERLEEAAERVDALSARLGRLRDVRRAPVVGARTDELLAARAITVDGELPSLRDAVVVQFVGPHHGAVGTVAGWGLPAEGRVLAGRAPALVGEGDPLPETAGRPVVVLVRNSVRSPWMRDRVRRLARRARPVVVVEFGAPDPDLPAPTTYICTWGASRAVAAPLDTLLADAAR